LGESAFAPRGLPEGLEILAELALDLRWIWSHYADHIWRQVDPDAWDGTHNPWFILQEASRDRLDALAADPSFRADLASFVAARARTYAASERGGGLPSLSRPVAYFSMEYGLGDAIPLHAGGLGVLAGDHLEAASDLGVPMVAVGLLYQEGYFRQMLDAAGRQEALYPYNDPSVLPIQPTTSRSGDWLKIGVELPGRTVWLRVWQAMVGRVTLYLLDTNLPLNQPVDRGITSKLYGDGPETRLRQEIVLGIGGWRLLDTLGLEPGACHLNEGHAAFAVLERARAAMRAHGLDFAAALAATRAGNVFTTHTPVAAGFDVFPPALLAKYFPGDRGLLPELGIGFAELLALGRVPNAPPDEPFRPAYLAVRGASRVSAVSALHAETSRALFQGLFPRWPAAEVPIGHVTNGVHVPSWDSPFSDAMWTEACGPERWRGSLDRHEALIGCVGDQKIWTVRGQARSRLVGQVRARLGRQLARRGAAPDDVEIAARALDPDVLTLAIARRFAEYKRPNLLLRDPDRLRRLLTDTQRPVQIVVAGKAHPDDADGKALVEAWVQFAADARVRARCVFLEDYDLVLAQELVQGVDVWINTPRRPYEACGTSGMKVLVNGGLNLSVLDGWWAEAYDPALGWAVKPVAGTPGEVDAHDAGELYRILEQEIVPGFYDRDREGMPRAWLARVRASLARLTPRFSATRMLADYVERCYRPAELELERRTANRGAAARELAARGARVAAGWAAVHFGQLETRADAGGGREIQVQVFLADLAADDVCVELYADSADAGAAPERVQMTNAGALPGTANGFRFRAALPTGRPPSDYTARIVPAIPGASIPLELPLVYWHH
jgi:starch phosphorylase